MRLVEVRLAPATRRALFDELLTVARRGIDVQDFDPDAANGGTKPALVDHRGYYGEVDHRRLQRFGELLRDVLEAHGETQALEWFDAVRRVPHADVAEVSDLPCMQLLQMLDDDFGGIEPEDLRSPNGLRIPGSVVDEEAARRYSALLLLPKLLCAAMAGLAGMWPWLDPDMDLRSAVHTIRPDPDKLGDSSGYGAAHLPCHTDGYWGEAPAVPVWNVMLCVINPFGEPTAFIRVADLFRVLDERHPEYERWAQQFADLRRPGESPFEFVSWVVGEAVKPQFDFVMGKIGSGASRAVRGVPLFERQRAFPGHLFRYKSTFSARHERARPVVEFVNRMVAYLSEAPPGDLKRELRLNPGEVVFALNGACLHVSEPERPPAGGVAYPVTGSATIHGRHALRIVDSRVRRTIVRCNMVVPPEARPAEGEPLEHDGQVARLLQSGYRANHLLR